ncbi:phage major capsid protein [Mycolicibacterium sp. S2-37]|uniref:phage major capsid protein n=1 Tax=Mycolicibacterium sp. S2-37 TaxID=2810297 RepID=UPI001A94A5BD|nr:phage major capsid protein [Mycolicibacterium sp. S2-37]MBO0676798.1 phage major capsid protein [Mycolicibacterium sp. S2-37]
MFNQIDALTSKRAEAVAAVDALVEARKAITDAVAAESRSELTADEAVTFRAKTKEIAEGQALIEDLDEQIRELKAEEERAGRLSAANAEIARSVAKVTVTNEHRTYEKGNGKSYVQDLLARSFGVADEDVTGRLMQHGNEVRALNRTDGTGGYLVPPAWLMDRFIELARAGRAYANLVPSEALPPGTDSINIPKISTGTATAIQTADNTAIEEVDLTDTSVQCGVKTIAGAQALSIQALEQSPLNFDEIIFRDLAGDYATKLDLQVISGSNTGNQVKGVRNASGIITVTATDAGSQLSKVKTAYQKIADAIQQIHTSRFMAPEVIVMHPRRWAAFQAVFAGDDRPFVAGSGAPSVPQIGIFSGVVSQQVVGALHGLPVVTDPNLPTTLGAGTNEDVIHVLRASDLLLFESGIRARTLDQTRADNLTILLQIYGFLAFTAERQPKSVCEIGGTALTAPTFA